MAQRAMCHPSLRKPFEVVEESKVEKTPPSSPGDGHMPTDSKGSAPSASKGASGKSGKKFAGKKKKN